jgi:multidrug efflux pump subunit AcrA (membrane-fusion protein)
MDNKKLIIFIAIIAIIGGLIAINIFAAGRAQDESGIARNATPVHWELPSSQTIESRVSARGSVQLRDKTIVFPETQAQIISVHVNVGDVVDIGDALITYDETILQTMNDQLAEARLALRSAELGLAATRIAATGTELLAAETQIEQSRTNVASIEAQLYQIDLQLSQAQDTHQNTQWLFDNGVVARIELENAADAVRRLQSQRDAAAVGLPAAKEAVRLAEAQRDALVNRSSQPQTVNQAQLQQVSIERALLAISQIERNIEDFVHEELATVAGTILNIFVEEGEFSMTGRPLLEIADVSEKNLVVIVHVPENDSGGIALGQEVEIRSGAIGNHRYAGVVELIHPLALPRQMGNTVETVVTVEIAVHGTSRLRAGNTVDADILTKISEDTLVVPLMSTVGSGGGEAFVWLITDDFTLQRRTIELGEFSAMYIEAIGITAYDRVVKNPTAAFSEGMQVRPIPSIAP